MHSSEFKEKRTGASRVVATREMRIESNPFPFCLDNRCLLSSAYGFIDSLPCFTVKEEELDYATGNLNSDATE